jgi:hypothetical protein
MTGGGVLVRECAAVDEKKKNRPEMRRKSEKRERVILGKIMLVITGAALLDRRRLPDASSSSVWLDFVSPAFVQSINSLCQTVEIWCIR